MSISLAITFGQRSGSDWVEDTTDYSATLKLVELNALYAQQAPASTDGHGRWTFTNVADGDYKYQNSGVDLANFGQVRVGAYDAVKVTGNQTVAGNKTFSGTTVAKFNANGNCSMAGYELSGLVDTTTGSAAVRYGQVNTLIAALAATIAAYSASRNTFC